MRKLNAVICNADDRRPAGARAVDAEMVRCAAEELALS